MARENKTKYIILGLLSHEPLTGYDIRQIAERAISNFWTEISYGQIYPTLKKLEKEGLVSKSIEVKENSPLRKVYSITSEGHKELRTWLETPADREVFKLDILLKLYFGAQTSIENSMKNIEMFRERNEKQLEEYKGFENNLRETLDESEDHFYILMTVLLGQHITKAQLQWVEEVLPMLQERAK
ncbi:MAG: PadR family transcriptional regulator [Candidatus Hermodarchaeota archaeon]